MMELLQALESSRCGCKSHPEADLLYDAGSVVFGGSKRTTGHQPTGPLTWVYETSLYVLLHPLPHLFLGSPWTLVSRQSPPLKPVLRGLCSSPRVGQLHVSFSCWCPATRGATGLSSAAAEAWRHRATQESREVNCPRREPLIPGRQADRSALVPSSSWRGCSERQCRKAWPLRRQSCKTEQLVPMKPSSGWSSATPSGVLVLLVCFTPLSLAPAPPERTCAAGWAFWGSQGKAPSWKRVR